MKKTILIFIVVAMALSAGCAKKILAPSPYGPVPTENQLEWQKMEYYMFVHFGPNTFTNVEWGDGKEDINTFYPLALDCGQWAATAKAAGMKGIILTAKHHDGFCLWPSRFSAHTVRQSRWQDGSGDVVREVADACRRYGLRFGVYVSPWDRNHPAYGTPEYNEVFASTLREVLTNYGDIFEQWLDGANGEGPNGKRQPYEWELFHKTIYECQSGIMIFSDVGPDCRWIGNERGVAGETNWSRLDTEGFTPGIGAPPTDTLNRGNVHGAQWLPGEVDVSLRPGWFYSPETDDKIKTLKQLFDIYHTSVGRNANLLLNVPPSRTGRIHPADSTRLMELHTLLNATFTNNLAAGATITASEVRGNNKRYAPTNLLLPDYDSYWATNDHTLQATCEVTLPEPRSFNRLQLQEYIPLGQRIAAWNAEYFDTSTGRWMPLAQATTIGYKRIVVFDTVTTDRVRINITSSLACPVVNGLGLFFAPAVE